MAVGAALVAALLARAGGHKGRPYKCPSLPRVPRPAHRINPGQALLDGRQHGEGRVRLGLVPIGTEK